MTNDSKERRQRVIDGLNSNETFTREQVAFVLALAFNLDRTTESAYLAGRADGYWERVEQENRAYPPSPWILVQGVKVRGDQAAARAAAVADRTQRWAGGTADDAMREFMWAADRPQPTFDSRPLRVRIERGVCVWDDE